MRKRLERFSEALIGGEVDGFGLEFVVKTERGYGGTTFGQGSISLEKDESGICK